MAEKPVIAGRNTQVRKLLKMEQNKKVVNVRGHTMFLKTDLLKNLKAIKLFPSTIPNKLFKVILQKTVVNFF